MWIDSTNKVSQDEVIAPLSHDLNGSFSRKGKKKTEKEKYDPEWYDTLIIILYITLICSMDLILFAGSGKLKIFDGSVFPISEVMTIISVIFVLAVCMVLPCWKKREYKYGIAGLVTAGVVYVICRQFFLYNQQVSLGGHMFSIATIAAVIIGALAFIVFMQDRVLFRSLFVVAIGVLFLNIYTSYYRMPINHEFEEVFNKQKKVNDENKRLIYFFFPNFSSYAYLSHLDTPEAIETRDIMQGFYQKYDFMVFPKAYTPEKTAVYSMLRSFNPTSDKKVRGHTVSTHFLDSYWRFYNIRNEYTFLQDNELYDLLKKEKYQISAYQSHEINICKKRNKMSVKRCIEKVNKPISLENTDLSFSNRLGVLTMEWLTSMHLFGELSNFYGFVKKAVSLDSLPVTSLDFNNMYAVDSIKTFDILLENIKQDTGKQAYFVYIDLPSSMYVYDEFCHIKPREEWQSMLDVEWIRKNYKDARQKAYMQQTRCLFGKLGQFMENLEKKNLLEDSTIIMHGISATNDFKRNTEHVTASERFLGSRSVSMAIFGEKLESALKKEEEPQQNATDPNNPAENNTVNNTPNTATPPAENKEEAEEEEDDSMLDTRLCSTNQVVMEYLYPDKKCDEHVSDYHEKTIEVLNEEMVSLIENIDDDNIDTFEEWYKTWKKKAPESKYNDALVGKMFDKDDSFGIDDLDTEEEKTDETTSEKETSKDVQKEVKEQVQNEVKAEAPEESIEDEVPVVRKKYKRHSRRLKNTDENSVEKKSTSADKKQKKNKKKKSRKSARKKSSEKPTDIKVQKSDKSKPVVIKMEKIED